MATGSPTNAALSDVISKVAEIQLQRRELLTSTVVATSLPPADNRAQDRRIAGMDADFLLVLAYATSGEKVVMDLSFVRMGDGSTLGRREEVVPLDLDLDSRVARAVTSLAEEPAVKAAIGAANAGRTTATTAIAPAPRPLPPPEIERTSIVAQDWGFALSLQGAPMFIVGDASDYFRYGADVSVFAGVRFPTRNVSLEVGASLGAAQLFPAAGPSQGTIYMLPEGIGIRAGSLTSLPIGVSAQASAGAAIVTVIPQSGEPMAKTDAYLQGAVSGYLRLVRSMVMGLEMGSLVVFEETHPIIAIVPALVVRIAR